jgi:hypothetical protein
MLSVWAEGIAMKRTELLALAERLSESRLYGRDIMQAADFLRQIAEAKPRAYAMHRNGIVYDILTQTEYADGLHFGQQSVPLYTLPLED